MNATYNQTPGILDVKVRNTDAFNMSLEWNISLVGYTFTASVTTADPVPVEVPITVTENNLSSGLITLSLSQVQIASIGIGSHSWGFSWEVASVPRTILVGKFKVV